MTQCLISGVRSDLSHQKRSLPFHAWRSFTQRYRRSRPSSSVRQRSVTCSTESSPAKLCRTIRSRWWPEPHHKAGQDAGARHDRTGATARQYRCEDADRASRPPSATTRFALATLGLSIRARRNNGLRTCSADGVHEGVRVIAFVGNHGAHAPMRRCSTNSCAQEISETSPSVAIIRRGRPASSTARCSLVVSPPRECSSPCGPLFFGLRPNAGAHAR